MGIEVMGKWEWECSVGMGTGGNGNGNDQMGVGREWEQESHSRTPLIGIYSRQTPRSCMAAAQDVSVPAMRTGVAYC